MNFKPEAFFIDLDGTTLDDYKKPDRISDENVALLKGFNDNNIPVIIATGRANSPFVMNLAKKINSPYVICQNGGLIVDQNNNVLKVSQMKKDDVIEIIKILKEEKMFFIINSGDTIYGSSGRAKFIRPWAKKLTIKSYDEIPKIEDSTKVLTFGTTKRGILKLRDKIASRFNNLSLHIVSRGYSIEINDYHATKGFGDSFVCQLLNIDPKKAVHLGDSGNDVTTKGFLGAFVCMKNGLKNIKKQADMIGLHFKKAGVGNTIKKLLA